MLGCTLMQESCISFPNLREVSFLQNITELFYTVFFEVWYTVSSWKWWGRSIQWWAYGDIGHVGMDKILLRTWFRLTGACVACHVVWRVWRMLFAVLLYAKVGEAGPTRNDSFAVWTLCGNWLDLISTIDFSMRFVVFVYSNFVWWFVPFPRLNLL